MSTLKVDAISGRATAGSISVTGEGNSTTTNLQQGLCKVWCKFSGDSVSGTGDDSFNVTSLSDDGTGDYTITITNDFSDVNFVFLSNSAISSFDSPSVLIGGKGSGSFSTTSIIGLFILILGLDIFMILKR